MRRSASLPYGPPSVRRAKTFRFAGYLVTAASTLLLMADGASCSKSGLTGPEAPEKTTATTAPAPAGGGGGRDVGGARVDSVCDHKGDTATDDVTHRHLTCVDDYGLHWEER